jgi:signal transduction histidine kinase
VILIGVVLVTAPLWRRLLDSRAQERAGRIRSEERAAVAAHLHDSVLQTLALIQRHADEPQAVSRLARSQERELRAWLYDPKVVREGGTWAGLVAGMVADVESDHELTVDPVVVGDAPVDEALAALGAATREALVNAAKHSGAPAADLYTEVTPERVSVFVRDRGKGFDPATVPSDRRGLADSVAGRLARLGGTAEVRSAAGEGTEVELMLPRGAA